MQRQRLRVAICIGTALGGWACLLGVLLRFLWDPGTSTSLSKWLNGPQVTKAVSCETAEIDNDPSRMDLQAPISFELIPMSEGDLGAEDGRQTLRMRMRNKNYFAGTAGLQLHFRLLLDGQPLRIGDLLQQDPDAWLPGGSTQIAPQVPHNPPPPPPSFALQAWSSCMSPDVWPLCGSS